MHRSFIFSVIVTALGLVIISCAPIQGQASKPTVIIASPPSGSVYVLGEEVVVQSTATDPNGVTQVSLLVDGQVVRDDPSPIAQGQAQFSLIQSWIADSLGQHTLTVRATNSQGATADGAILINVREQPAGTEPTAIIAIATAVPLATATTAPTSGPGTALPPVTVLVTATSAPSTSVPPATALPPCVPNSQFVADVTIPDGTVFTPNAVFAKTWRVRNTSACLWENYSLAFVTGTQMAASGVYPVPNTPPGATADLVVPMTAPASYGSYGATWRMRTSTGQLFGTNLTVLINVPSPATAVPPTNTPPPTAAGCSGQPDDFAFDASLTDITAGQAVTLSWPAVTNASAVYIIGGEFGPDPGQGVSTPGNRVVSPNSTTQYKLKAICNNSGQEREKTRTINVSADVGDFSGNWVINFGNMNLTQDGAEVTGTYNQLFYDTSGSIAGTVTDDQFVGTWSISGTSGSVVLNLVGGGDRIEGVWNGVNSWCGARPGENFPNGCSFAGSWITKIPSNDNCQMTLQRRDNIVTGNYCNGTIQATITYPINDDITVATGNWDTGSSIGEMTFYLIGFNALQFRGNYNDSFEWCGWRSGQAQPAPCEQP